jgi:hypothetical protein
MQKGKDYEVVHEDIFMRMFYALLQKCFTKVQK